MLSPPCPWKLSVDEKSPRVCCLGFFFSPCTIALQ